MATDVRSLLKNERAARRIQHEYASYSTTGSLLCTACHLQLKSETLWDGHLRSASHITRLQKLQQTEKASEPTTEGNKKKRKASEGEDTIRKRTKAANGLPEGFFDESAKAPKAIPTPPLPSNEMQIPSRPATPLKPVEDIPKRPDVDDDEWAAFEADIAKAEAAAKAYEDAVISAPAMTTAELAAKDKEEEYQKRKERQEAELEGDKEDAARKLEEEFEEMESLEQRVRKLREKREALRKDGAKQLVTPAVSVVEDNTAEAGDDENDNDDDDDDDDDEWDGFRMK
ncbi:hypothetical protein B0O99DRAFT_527307 [Bisporella sp. PMI_857]|nr:hypothetical protein B0O99DRAFT_527307 [Bisporella sp. PMI_857]